MNVFYTGDLDSATSQNYLNLIRFLQNANPIALVHFEDEYKARWTVEDLLKELPAPNKSAEKMCLSDCEYIRILGVER